MHQGLETASNGASRTYNLSFNIQTTHSNQPLNITFLVERDKSKAFASTRITVNHDCCINDLSKLIEKVAHGFVCHRWCQTTDKHFLSSIVFLTWDRPFRVYLHQGEDRSSLVVRRPARTTHDFAIEVVLPDHHSIDSCRILKC